VFHAKGATHRRDILGGIATLGAVAGLAQATDSAQAVAAEAATDFTRWLDSIGGKQRQLFDAPEPNEGFALIWSYAFLATGPKAYALPEKELGVVIVLRHNGIPLAFSDGLWSKYKVGEFFRINDPVTKKPATRNFFANSKPEDLLLPDAAIDRLMARGVKVAVCNLALTVYSGMVAKQMNVPADQVHKEWVAGLLPGSQVVPSGVVAVNGAQSRGCGYCFAG
jgi:intracellular sulfur oxidation DsrE/DsrF family protein